MKLLKFLASLVLLFAFLVVSLSGVYAQRRLSPSPSPSPTIAPVNSYELFWPITAGRVMGESLYFLKSFKEDLRELLIFSELKKADYNITLSEKRTVEAEKLFIARKDYSNAKNSLDVAQLKREKALELIQRVEKKGRDVENSKNRMTRSLENQRALLHYIATQLPEDQKDIVKENVDILNATLAKLL